MEPVRIEVPMWKCGVCQRQYAHEDRAAACCMCTACEERPALPSASPYALDRRCARCNVRHARQAVKLARKHLESTRADAAARIASAEMDLAKAEADHAEAKKVSSPP